MPRIVLKDLETEKALSVADTEGTIGRDPASAFVIDGPKSKVVSGRHARIFFQDAAWWIEDTSRNGTILDDERLQVGQRHGIRVGQVIGLGESGPRFRVTALESRAVAATIMEAADASQAPAAAAAAPRAPAIGQIDTPVEPKSPTDLMAGRTTAMRRSEAIRAGLQFEESTEPMSPAPDWHVHAVVRHTTTNQKHDVKAQVVKFGRSPECNVQIPAEHGASVSRVHCEISIQDGGVSLKDSGSRNGTFHNGKRLEGPHPLMRGDLVMLGSGGPTFAVDDLHIVKGHAPPQDESKRGTGPSIGGSPTDPSPEEAASEQPTAPPPAPAASERPVVASRATAFASPPAAPAEDPSQKSLKRMRAMLWAIGGIAVVLGGVVVFFVLQR